jgi:AraC-like DNA-binding protein
VRPNPPTVTIETTRSERALARGPIAGEEQRSHHAGVFVPVVQNIGSTRMTQVTSCTFSLGGADLLQARASARQFDPHLHDTFSIVILTKGRASLRSARWSAIADAGDVFIFNPFEVHEGAGSQAAVEYHVLYASVRFVADCLGAHDRRFTWPTLRSGVVRSSALTSELAGQVGRSAVQSTPLEAALEPLLRERAVDEQDTEAKTQSAVRAACVVIHERYMDPLSTEQLAKYARLHKCHFVRTFHRVTGLSPQTYLRQVRLARARELIFQGAAPIEAAHATGFSDQAHLTREFKRVYGVTPGHLSRDLRRY